jgi:UPF0755 protein
MTRKWVWISLAACLVLIVAVAGFAAFSWRQLNAPLAIPAEGTTLDVASGTAFTRIAADLAERDHLRNPWLLATYARLTDDATRVRAGEYRLEPGITPLTLLEKLVAGDVVLHQLTIVEGSRFTDVVTALRAHPAIVATSLDSDAIMAALGHRAFTRRASSSRTLTDSREARATSMCFESRTRRWSRSSRRSGATAAATSRSRTNTRR